MFAICKYCLKAALTSRHWIILLYSFGASAWALLLYPIVIQQSVSLIGDLLTNQKLVTDGAVLTTIEAIAGILISIRLLDNYFVLREKRSRWLKFLKVSPGILFPVGVVYFELLFFKSMVGGNFFSVAIIYSAILGLGIVAFSYLIRYLIPHESAKLELKMLLNMGILIIGLLINSSVADYNISSVDYDINWLGMLILFIVSIIFIVLGFYIPQLKKLFKNVIKR